MSIEQSIESRPSITIIEEPYKEITIRGKKIALPRHATPLEQIALYALLALESKEVDDLLIQFKMSIADGQGRVIFDYKRGGWVK